jgi:hypothetical protein
MPICARTTKSRLISPYPHAGPVSAQDNAYGPKNYPGKTARTVQHLVSHFGKRFLNDPFWSKYDVVIHSNSGNLPGYQAIAGNFEEWVRLRECIHGPSTP